MNVNNLVYEISKLISDYKELKETKIGKIILSSTYGKFAK